MRHKDRFLVVLLVLIVSGIVNTLHARNCSKGKPCGKGCIAMNKTCHINESKGHRPINRDQPKALRRSVLRLPKVYTVISESVQATQAPNSSKVTGHYKKGQSVFVYETTDGWARLSNMQPEEWVELKQLRRKSGS
jgi:uncharacterized protein YgiM (DUF1202 family)